ncbi:MAG: PEP-CTERM sorting domain-containing protein [Puniceicoccaceae bacterium]
MNNFSWSLIAFLFLLHTVSAQLVVQFAPDAFGGTTIHGSLQSGTLTTRYTPRLPFLNQGVAHWGLLGDNILGTYDFTGTANGNSISGKLWIWETHSQFTGFGIDLKDSLGSNISFDEINSIVFTASATSLRFDAIRYHDPQSFHQLLPLGTSLNANLSAIPEPSTYAALLGGAFLLLIAYRRFRLQRRSA